MFSSHPLTAQCFMRSLLLHWCDFFSCAVSIRNCWLDFQLFQPSSTTAQSLSFSFFSDFLNMWQICVVVDRPGKVLQINKRRLMFHFFNKRHLGGVFLLHDNIFYHIYIWCSSMCILTERYKSPAQYLLRIWLPCCQAAVLQSAARQWLVPLTAS